MKSVISTIAILLLSFLSTRAAEVRVRPADWAQPIIGAKSLSNAYKVSVDLYRSEQPSAKDLSDIQQLGIKTLISMRNYHDDSDKYAEAGIGTIRFKMNAGSVTEKDLVLVLRAIRSNPKPVLVHCWHGSDRTGFIVAGYRIIEQKWPVDKAIEELKLGGYGYHAPVYRNIVELLGKMDVEAVRKDVLAP